MGDVYYGHHPGLIIDPVDHPVGATASAEPVVHWLFDDPLLFRDGRKMIATPLAESLAKQVRDVLDQIESILADRTDFDPARAQRTFTIIASDVLSVILLKPLRARLAIEAPSVRVRVSPPAVDDAERLRRNQVEHRRHAP